MAKIVTLCHAHAHSETMINLTSQTTPMSNKALLSRWLQLAYIISSAEHSLTYLPFPKNAFQGSSRGVCFSHSFKAQLPLPPFPESAGALCLLAASCCS